MDDDKDVDEEGPEEDDGDDDQQDPFEVHFNQVSDTFIEEQEKVLKDKPKWTFADKKAWKMRDILIRSRFRLIL